MKLLPAAVLLILLTPAIFLSAQAQAEATVAPNAAGPRSITELATLSNILIHHYDCTADLLLSPDSLNREVKFAVTPLVKGETGPTQTLQLQGDKLVASANGQMLSLEWTRMGHSVANAKTMIVDSPMRSYNLIVIDPGNPDQQAQMVCNGITFAQAAQQNAAAVVGK